MNPDSPSNYILTNRIEVVEFTDPHRGTRYRSEFVAPSGKRRRCICEMTILSGFTNKDDAMLEASMMAEVTGLSIYHTQEKVKTS